MRLLIQQICEQLEAVQNEKLWIGCSFDSLLSKVEVSRVFERPTPHLHSIAEMVSHLTLWRQETLLKIKTGEGSKTDDCEENWMSLEKLKIKGWTAIKAEYDQTLMELLALLQHKEDAFLEQTYYDTDFKGQYPYKFVLWGMLHHDLYHLGQLGIIVKHLNSKPLRSEV